MYRAWLSVWPRAKALSMLVVIIIIIVVVVID